MVIKLQNERFSFVSAQRVWNADRLMCFWLWTRDLCAVVLKYAHREKKNQFDLIKRFTSHEVMSLNVQCVWLTHVLGSRYWNSMNISTSNDIHSLIISNKAEKRKCDKTLCRQTYSRVHRFGFPFYVLFHNKLCSNFLHFVSFALNCLSQQIAAHGPWTNVRRNG